MSSTQLLALFLALVVLPLACAQAPPSEAPTSATQRAPAKVPAAYVVSACYRASPGGPDAGPARCVLVREAAGGKSGIVQCLEELAAQDDVRESSSVVESGAWTRARDALQGMKKRLAESPSPTSRGRELPHRLLFFGSPSDQAIGCLGVAELRQCGDPFTSLWDAIEVLGSECK